MNIEDDRLLGYAVKHQKYMCIILSLARRKIPQKRGWSEMTEYCFVVDKNNKQLSPTKVNKGWYLIRKQKAELVSKYPMVIRIRKEIKAVEQDKSEFVCGIDDGSVHVGIAIVQKCSTYNKPIFKATIEQRKDVKSLIDTRRGYRKYHRQHKRYRKARFDNRSANIRKGRIAPSIKQKKEAILRIIKRLNKYINISKYHLEDVSIDIRQLTDDKKLYSWQYQKTNRLDENIRRAVILRDNNKCAECGKTNCKLEVHHIVPKRMNGNNTLSNLITLCSTCHQKTEGKEIEFADKYYKMIAGKNIRLDYAQHVMQGKTYLRQELNRIGKLILTTGGDTANKRIDWNIEKTHSNDAIVITDLFVNSKSSDIKDWIIKPMRRKSKASVEEINGFKHRDLVKYTKKNGESYIGYITALYPEKRQCNITMADGQLLKRYGIKSLKLLWRFNKIYFM